VGIIAEIMDFGYPQNLSPEILKLYITQEGVRSPFSSKVKPSLVLASKSMFSGTKSRFCFFFTSCIFDIEAAARTKGGKIIGLKGATFYGVATCLARISRAVLANENTVLPVGAYLDGQYHQHGLYLGTPAVINANGIDHILELPLSPEEQEKMAHSAGAVQSVLTAAFAS